jgi:hypothetical protein
MVLTSAFLRKLVKERDHEALEAWFAAARDAGVAVEPLVRAGNVNSKTALHFAAQWCGRASVALLLEHGADVDAATVRGQEPLAFAIGRRRYENIEVLLDAGASARARTVQGETPLGMAMRFISEERPDILQRIRRLAEDEAVPWRDYTADARAIAAQISHARTCDHCRSLAGAPAVRAPRGGGSRTAHQLAAKVRRAASGRDASELRDILDAGGDVESPTAMAGRTALMLAAWRGAVENVHLLLERGAAIDRWTTGSGNYGKTPIFYAITRCRDDVVCALLRAGARVTLVNNKGQSPLSLAASHCAPATVGFLFYLPLHFTRILLTV